MPFRALLRRASLLFLTVPLLVFLGGFLRLPLAMATCAVVLAGLWRSWPQAVHFSPAGKHGSGISGRTIPWVALPAAALTLLSGVGGWGSGDSDWLKHDTLLPDLLTRPWPVTYETGGGPVLLVYYTAFYLPAALLGKLVGESWNVASQALALTMFVGVVLSALWLVVLGTGGLRVRRRGGFVVVAVFFGFSGLDVLGKILVNAFYGLPPFHGNWWDIEWWAQFAQYPSNAAALFWAPQHAFGAWLPLALALDDWFAEGAAAEDCTQFVRTRGVADTRVTTATGPGILPSGSPSAERRGLESSTVFYLALALFWTPFAVVGLAPILGALLLCRGKQAGWKAAWWGRFLTWPNAAGIVAGGVFSLYLLAHFQSYPLPTEYRVTPGFLPMPLLEISRVPLPVIWAVFVAVEFAGLSAALMWFFAGRRDEEARRMWPPLWLATATLLGLPWCRYGYANDLVMRGSLPALFVLQVLLVRMFAAAGDGKRRGALVLAALLLAGGLGNAGIEYSRHVVRMTRQGSWRDTRTREPVRSLAGLARTVYARPGFDFTRQYLGSADSFFARKLAARRGALAPGATPPPSDF